MSDTKQLQMAINNKCDWAVAFHDAIRTIEAAGGWPRVYDSRNTTIEEAITILTDLVRPEEVVKLKCYQKYVPSAPNGWDADCFIANACSLKSSISKTREMLGAMRVIRHMNRIYLELKSLAP